MQNQIQSSPVKKSLYVFLTTLLGVLLFFTIQRAAALVSLLLVNTDYGTYSLNISPLDLHALNVSTILLAVFFGGWYGVWLGLHWYEYVYETEHKGWLFGITGNLFNHNPIPAKTVINKVNEPSNKVHTTLKASSPQTHKHWELDDLLPKKSMDMQAPSKIMPAVKSIITDPELVITTKPKVVRKKAVTKIASKRKVSKVAPKTKSKTKIVKDAITV